MPMYFDLDVSLPGIEPRVWRRLRMIGEATFGNLRYAIQQAFGWQDCHLYRLRRVRDNGSQLAEYA